MTLKHKEKWPIYIHVAKEYNLDTEQTLLLLAIIETEDINEGNELRKLQARGKEVKEQAKVYCQWLKNRDFDYQRYLKRLPVDQEPFEFIEYIIETDTNLIRDYMKSINDEFSAKEIK